MIKSRSYSTSLNRQHWGTFESLPTDADFDLLAIKQGMVNDTTDFGYDQYVKSLHASDYALASSDKGLSTRLGQLTLEISIEFK